MDPRGEGKQGPLQKSRKLCLHSDEYKAPRIWYTRSLTRFRMPQGAKSSLIFLFVGDGKHQQLFDALEDYFIATLGNWSEKKAAVELENTVQVAVEVVVKREQTDSLTLATEEGYHLVVRESKDNISKVNLSTQLWNLSIVIVYRFERISQLFSLHRSM